MYMCMSMQYRDRYHHYDQCKTADAQSKIAVIDLFNALFPIFPFFCHFSSYLLYALTHKRKQTDSKEAEDSY